MNELPSRKVLASGKYLQLVAQAHWEFAERVNATGAVAIVAISERRQLVLVEQYRIPVGCAVIELPAGLVGDLPKAESPPPAESPAENAAAESADAAPLQDAARRELLEETGYDAAEMRLLGAGPTSAGLSNEVVTFFYASGLRRLNSGGGVDHEQITVHELPLETLDAWLKKRAGEGLMIDPKIYAGLYLMQRAGIA
jgi:ADP-ribose pyrophosphatase